MKDLLAVVDVAAQDPYGLSYRALAHSALRKDSAALKDFDAAIEGGVRLPALYYARADTKARLRDRRGAIEDFTRYLDAAPLDALAHVERGRERACENDSLGALQDFNRAIELNPALIPAYYYRAYIRGSEDKAAADEDYRRACGIEPVDSNGFYFRGLARESLGRHEEAVPDFSRALALSSISHPRHAEIEEKAEATRKKKRGEALLRAPATWAFMGANVAVWLLQGDLWGVPDGPTLVERGALWGPSVWQGEYWRHFTSMFVHIGVMHLFWNLYGGYWACSAVENLIGTRKFVVVYVLSGLGASAVSLVCHVAAAAGASGALFGVLGMVLVSYYVKLGSLYYFFNFPFVRRLLWNIGVWFLLGLTLIPMDNYAHLGGLVFGVLLGLLFMKGPAWSRVKRWTAWVGVMGLLSASTVAAGVPRGDDDEMKAWVVEKKAEEAYVRGDYPAALKLYDEALQLFPKAPERLLNRALAHYMTGNRRAAMDDLRKALELAPSGWPTRGRVEGMIHSLEKGENLR